MENFQKIVLIMATIILIIILLFIGINLAKLSSNQVWPPVIPQCPDYWEIDESEDKPKCKNTLKLGTCSASSGTDYQLVDFNSPEFTGDNALCSKYNWASKCNVSWDGITYGVENPCITAQNAIISENEKKNSGSSSYFIVVVIIVIIVIAAILFMRNK